MPVAKLIVHSACQPSHDWAANDPATDFGIKGAWVLQTGEKTMVDYPEQLTLVLTTKCNLRCKVCYQNEFSSSFNLDLLEKLTDVISKVEWLHLKYDSGIDPHVFTS